MNMVMENVHYKLKLLVSVRTRNEVTCVTIKSEISTFYRFCDEFVIHFNHSSCFSLVFNKLALKGALFGKPYKSR